MPGYLHRCIYDPCRRHRHGRRRAPRGPRARPTRERAAVDLAVDAAGSSASTSGPTIAGQQRLERRLAQAAVAALGRDLGAHDARSATDDSRLATNDVAAAEHDARDRHPRGQRAREQRHQHEHEGVHALRRARDQIEAGSRSRTRPPPPTRCVHFGDSPTCSTTSRPRLGAAMCTGASSSTVDCRISSR